MADDIVQFTESTARRIVRATRIVEDSQPTASRISRASRSAPAIRAVLLEPLTAGGVARAERTEFDDSRFWFDVLLLGYPTSVDSTFRVSLVTHERTARTSTDIRIDATAADLSAALVSWGLPGRVSVGFGRRGDLIFGRWSIGVSGPFTRDPDGPADLVRLTVSGSIAGAASLVSVRSKWRPTGEVVELHEGGLIAHDSDATPLRPGAAVHASLHYGAGYVVHAAESRKFSTINLVSDHYDFYADPVS